MTRPNRSVPHPGHTAGVKRSAEYALTCGKPVVTGAPGVSGRRAMDRTVSGEVEIRSDGALLKRSWW